MRISEIYPALSGEGVHTGTPVTIVRLHGCNLGCTYCDSKYTKDNSECTDRSVDDILSNTQWLRWSLITGGEPLLQSFELLKLTRELKHKDVKVEIETNGSFAPPAWFSLVTSWSADIKCPSSGMCGRSRLDWLSMREQDQVKFVVSSEEDLRFAAKTLNGRRLEPAVLISPTYPWTNDWLRECVKFCLQHELRLSLQQHKIIFGDKRGV